MTGFAVAIQALCAASLAMASLICLYHLVLAAVALVIRRRSYAPSTSCSHSFAIVIPAHNEEHTIHVTLESCRSIDYPADKYRVYVIADNCSDRTAAVAQTYGTCCLVRHDESRLGKGFALEWALPQVLAGGADAVIILDADSRIDSHALGVLDSRISAGNRVLQLNNLVANPDDSVISYLLALGGFVANRLFWAPKSDLRWPVLLIGSGAVLHRDVLLRFPWRTRGLCEDTEYSLLLHENGISARFVSSVRVTSDFPVDYPQLAVQRRRWIRGQMGAAWKYGVKLMGKGLCSANLRLFDAGFSSIIVSRPLILLHLLLTGGLALLAYWVAPGAFSLTMLFVLAGLLAAYGAYTALGVVLFGITRRRLGFLLRCPGLTLRYFLLSVRALSTASSGTWDRTPRVGEHR